MSSRFSEEVRAKLKAEFPLFFIEMNDAQDRFIRVKNFKGETPKRRIFEAGNKIGKCVTYSTLISTPHGDVSVGRLFEIGKSFDVWAWDGSKRVISRASAPFKKDGLHQCYRVTMPDGRWIEAADKHRVLLTSGVYSTLDQLVGGVQSSCLGTSVSSRTYSGSLLRTISAFFRSVLLSGGGRLSERLSNYLCGCSEGSRRYGGQPLKVAEIVPISSPLSTCVRRPCVVLWHLDDLEHIHTHTSPRRYDHPSRAETLPRRVARFFESLCHDAYTFFQLCMCASQEVPQLSIAGVSQLQSSDEFSRPFRWECHGNDMATSYKPPLVDGNNNISIKPIPVKAECYDFSVEKYHNYCAGGLVHHNTWAGLAEDLAHMMGFRPWLKEDDPDFRIDIKVPNIGMIGCETYKHSVAEKIEPMLRFLTPSICQPVFKPGPTGVLNILTLPFDCFGKKCGSKVYLRSYDEQPSSFEGIDYDFLHWDEPPPLQIFQAAERGKVVTNAPSWFTMTPLKEAWIFEKLSNRAASFG